MWIYQRSDIMAGGRPAGLQYVVPLQDILVPAAIAAEKWRLGELYQELCTPHLALQWAACRRLLYNSVMYDSCQHPTTLVAREDCVDWTTAGGDVARATL